MSHRIHIFGASGAGTTSLGVSLAENLQVRFFDNDTYFWLDTDPPFTRRREPEERLALIQRDIRGVQSWVLAGSMCNWGDPLVHHLTLAIFLYLPPEQRLTRLVRREKQRHGSRIEPGGDMHANHTAFVEWARRYDYDKAPIRSLDLHETWIDGLPCPVIRMDSSRPVGELVDEILGFLATSRGAKKAP